MSNPPNEVTPAPDVYDVIFHQTDALGAGETRAFATDNTPSGRYLVIQLLADLDRLSRCEVQVTEHQGTNCGRFLWQFTPENRNNSMVFWYYDGISYLYGFLTGCVSLFLDDYAYWLLEF